MAEQLRYEQTLQRLNMPNVDFAAEKEIARGYNQISSKLDQMSSFFMKQAEGQAKIEGAEYGAENAPTAQQIEDAKSSGKELELPGDKFSVYGTAARSAALTAVYDDITLATKRSILQDLTDYEKQNLDPAMLQDKFNTLIDGYAATFDNTSPALARKFRAEMGIYAYGKVSTESSAFIKRERDERIATYAAGAELFLNSNSEESGLRTLIFGNVNETKTNVDTGEVIETKPSYEVITGMIEEEKKKLLTGAIAVGMSESQVLKLANAYDARVLQIQSNIVLEEMYKQGSDQRGVFYARVKQAVEKGPKSKVALELPPSVRAAFFSTKADDRNTIVNNLRTGWNNIMDDQEKEIGFNNTVREESVRKFSTNFNQQLVIYNDAPNAGAKEKALLSMEISLGELKKLDTEKYLEFKRAYDLHTKKGAGDTTNFALQNDVNQEALFEMDIVKVNPIYDMSHVVKALNEKKITFDYYKTMVQKYSNLYDDDFKAAIVRMKQELGVPSDMYLDKTWLNSQEANVLSAAISAMNTARREDTSGTFDADQWVTNNLPTIMTQQIPGQSGQDAALVQRMKGYTRRQILNFIDMANEAGDQERLQKWEGLLRDTDLLFQSPNFDQTKLPMWSLD